jgi:mannosyltransferase OCH1-like enzyme
MRRGAWAEDGPLLALAAEANRLALDNAGDHAGIPKIAHFIWLGSRAPPSYTEPCIGRFRDLHPDWRVIFWNDNNVQGFEWFMNKDIFSTANNMGM